MASNPNDAVFDNVANFVGERITEQLDVAVNDFVVDLRRFLNRYVDQFFSSLVLHNVGVDQPTYGPSAPKWADLSMDYWDRKASQGFPTEKYERTGDLKAALANQSAREIFGTPKVHQHITGRTNRNVFIDAAGRPQWRSGSGRRGFAAYADAFQNMAITLEIDLFPKAQGRKPSDLLGGRTGWWASKLRMLEHGRKNMPARPMMKPFMDWYTTDNLRQSVLRQFNVRI